MSKKINPKDTFSSNAIAQVDIEGEIIGRYKPTGPNKWDDYAFLTANDGDIFQATKGSSIQVEPIGAKAEVLFRAKKGREVLLLRWTLTPEDQTQIDSGKWGIQEAEQASKLEKILGLAPKNDPRDDMMEYFLDVKADPIGK
jgi:hypothetical protein